MKGLLRKDLYLLMKTGRMYLVISALFLAIYVLGDHGYFYFAYPSVMISMLGVSLISIDEHSRWDKYCASLPVTRAQTVTSKYLLLGVMVIAMALLSGLVAFFSRHNHQAVSGMTALAMGLGLFLPAINMPLCYKYGTEKARWVSFLALGGSIALFFIIGTMLFESIFNDPAAAPTASVNTMFLSIPLGLIAYVFSWRLSVKIYQSREL